MAFYIRFIQKDAEWTTAFLFYFFLTMVLHTRDDTFNQLNNIFYNHKTDYPKILSYSNFWEESELTWMTIWLCTATLLDYLRDGAEGRAEERSHEKTPVFFYIMNFNEFKREKHNQII